MNYEAKLSFSFVLKGLFTQQIGNNASFLAQNA